MYSRTLSHYLSHYPSIYLSTLWLPTLCTHYLTCVFIYTVEPLIKDTLNTGHLFIKDTLHSHANILVYYLTSEYKTPPYKGQFQSPQGVLYSEVSLYIYVHISLSPSTYVRTYVHTFIHALLHIVHHVRMYILLIVN